MNIRFRQEGRFPIAATDANLRGRDLVKIEGFAHLLAGDTGFSVNICNGRGELTMKKIDGVWNQKVDSVDQVFGHIRGRFFPVRFN